jgi:long-chain acyl-CoA synthetase
MNVTHGLRRSLQTNPRGTATIFGERRRTWREVGDRVARLAAGLKRLGVNAGDRVAVLSLNSDRYLELYLAVGWTAAVIVPLNTRWSRNEIDDALRDCRASLLFVDQAFAALGEGLSRDIPGLSLGFADDGAGPNGAARYEDLICASAPAPDAMAKRDDLAGIFYTGGTTGRSKGVMLSHGALMANALNALAEWPATSASIYLHAAPMFHMANGSGMYTNMLAGGSNVMITSFAPEPFMQAIERERVTATLLIPTMIQMIADHPKVGDYDLSSLQDIFYGGSPINEAVIDRTIKALPKSRLGQAYGMTELAPIATILPWAGHIGEGRAKGRHRSGGRATFGCEVKIVDAQGETAPSGVIGEICARGDNVMMGYWERPEETAKALIDGWMHTGDGGYMDDDGYVYVVDRLKDMIVSGGENVYSAEVENVVAQHPSIAQCAAIGIPSDQWGEQVHAVVFLKSGAALTEDELIAFCKERLAGYKCPRSAEIRSEPLPMSGAGKILKRELRRPFWEGRTRAVN